jgi:hypothetical protein
MLLPAYSEGQPSDWAVAHISAAVAPAEQRAGMRHHSILPFNNFAASPDSTTVAISMRSFKIVMRWRPIKCDDGNLMPPISGTSTPVG